MSVPNVAVLRQKLEEIAGQRKSSIECEDYLSGYCDGQIELAEEFLKEFFEVTT